MSKRLIIAIDGPAGSGKSTSAKLVAQKLGYLYIDTGAMYRAVTFLAIRNNVLSNNDSVIKIAETSKINLKFLNGVTHVSVDGEDITDNIRTSEVNSKVSDVSKIKEVREALVAKQRDMAMKEGGVVMEGRDIGTVVFPNADVKIFLTASIEQRAKRRAKEYEEKGIVATVSDIKNNLVKRDEIDSTREVSPLTKADDAVVVDTSKVTIEEQVNIIFDNIKIIAEKKGTKID